MIATPDQPRVIVRPHTRRKSINFINAELERRAQRDLTVQLLREYVDEKKTFDIPFKSRVVVKDVTNDFLLAFSVLTFFVGFIACAATIVLVTL